MDSDHPSRPQLGQRAAALLMAGPLAAGVLVAGVLVAGVLVAGVLVAGVMAAGPAVADVGPPGTRWVWPLDPRPLVLARFVAPAGPFAPGHRGADLAAAPGATVRAAGDGVIAFAGRVAGRAVVSIDHPGGLRTTYEPVVAVVSAGDPVLAGQVIGRLVLEGSHCLPASCLHWGARRGQTTYLDPLSLLATVRVRLLPVWGSAAGSPQWAAAARPPPGAGAEAGPPVAAVARGRSLPAAAPRGRSGPAGGVTGRQRTSAAALVAGSTLVGGSVLAAATVRRRRPRSPPGRRQGAL